MAVLSAIILANGVALFALSILTMGGRWGYEFPQVVIGIIIMAQFLLGVSAIMVSFYLVMGLDSWFERSAAVFIGLGIGAALSMLFARLGGENA